MCRIKSIHTYIKVQPLSLKHFEDDAREFMKVQRKILIMFIVAFGFILWEDTVTSSYLKCLKYMVCFILHRTLLVSVGHLYDLQDLFSEIDNLHTVNRTELQLMLT